MRGAATLFAPRGWRCRSPIGPSHQGKRLARISHYVRQHVHLRGVKITADAEVVNRDGA